MYFRRWPLEGLQQHQLDEAAAIMYLTCMGWWDESTRGPVSDVSKLHSELIHSAGADCSDAHLQSAVAACSGDEASGAQRHSVGAESDEASGAELHSAGAECAGDEASGAKLDSAVVQLAPVSKAYGYKSMPRPGGPPPKRARMS